MNRTRIKIIGTSLSAQQLATRCEKLYKLRTARKIGDEETVNQTQLGILKANSLDIQIEIL
jgi:hypothetical protein